MGFNGGTSQGEDSEEIIIIDYEDERQKQSSWSERRALSTQGDSLVIKSWMSRRC